MVFVLVAKPIWIKFIKEVNNIMAKKFLSELLTGAQLLSIAHDNFKIRKNNKEYTFEIWTSGWDFCHSFIVDDEIIQPPTTNNIISYIVIKNFETNSHTKRRNLVFYDNNNKIIGEIPGRSSGASITIKCIELGFSQNFM